MIKFTIKKYVYYLVPISKIVSNLQKLFVSTEKVCACIFLGHESAFLF